MSSPKVNKVTYQHADLELALAIGGKPLAISNAFTEMNYSDNVERELARGASQVAEDATDGEYTAEGSLIWHRHYFDYVNEWVASQGLGFYNVEMNLTVNLRQRGKRMKTDTIRRVRFGSRDASSSQGASPLLIPCDLFIIDRIFFNGIGPFGETL